MQGPWQSEARLVANGQHHQSANHTARHAGGQSKLAGEEGDPAIRRNSHDVLRHNPGRAPHRHRRAARLPANVHRDIDGRIANANDQDILVGKRGRRAIVMRVHLHPAERAGELGHARIPEVSVGDNHSAIVALLAAGERHRPAACGAGPDSLDARIEPDVRHDAGIFGVGFQILQHLTVRQEIGVGFGNREIRIAEVLAARVDMQAMVCGGHAVVVFVTPHAADLRPKLKALKRHALRAQ